jgi:AcrR family transcriptional regulator
MVPRRSTRQRRQRLARLRSTALRDAVDGGGGSQYFRSASGEARAATLAHQERARLLDAVMMVVAERGYAQLTVAKIAARAGVSQPVFFEHFADAEACFLFAYRAGAQVLVTDWARPQGDWRERLALGIEELTRAFVENPALTRSVFFESGEAGPRALELRQQVRDLFVERLRVLIDQARAEDPAIPPPSETQVRALVGGIRGLIEHHLLTRDLASLQDLNGPLVELAASSIAGERR